MDFLPSPHKQNLSLCSLFGLLPTGQWPPRRRPPHHSISDLPESLGGLQHGPARSHDPRHIDISAAGMVCFVAVVGGHGLEADLHCRSRLQGLGRQALRSICDREIGARTAMAEPVGERAMPPQPRRHSKVTSPIYYHGGLAQLCTSSSMRDLFLSAEFGLTLTSLTNLLMLIGAGPDDVGKP